MNDKSSQFNDERCPGKLGVTNDTTDVEELQSFIINFTFQEVPMENVKKVLRQFILKCMHKDKGIIFHPTNNQTLLPTSSPFSTKEKFSNSTP